MDALQALLGADLVIEKDVRIKRLGVDFRIKAIDGTTLTKAQEQCSHYVGKGAKREKVVDEQKLGAVLVQKACISPDFSNRQLIEKYGASDSADCVLKSLLAGEIATLTKAILDLSGFDDGEEAIEDAKN